MWVCCQRHELPVPLVVPSPAIDPVAVVLAAVSPGLMHAACQTPQCRVSGAGTAWDAGQVDRPLAAAVRRLLEEGVAPSRRRHARRGDQGAGVASAGTVSFPPLREGAPCRCWTWVGRPVRASVLRWISDAVRASARRGGHHCPAGSGWFAASTWHAALCLYELGARIGPGHQRHPARPVRPIPSDCATNPPSLRDGAGRSEVTCDPRIERRNR